MKKLAIRNIIVLLLLVVVSLTACASSSDDSEKSAEASTPASAEADASSDGKETDEVGEFTVRVGCMSGTDLQYLKILDDHTGLFKDQGIDLQVSEFAAGINTIDAIVQGQLDIGTFADYAGVNRIGNTVGNTELRAFVNTSASNATALYVNPDHIKEAEDLYDAVLLSQAGVVYEYDYGKLFETYDIDPTKVNIQDVDSIQGALALAANGQGDAFWASTLSTGPMFEEYGWKPFVSVEDVDATMYSFLVANESYLEEHHNEVVKFLKVSEEGFQYITDNLDEAAGWFSEETGMDKDLISASWLEVDHEYGFSKEAYEDLAKVEKWCYENGKFDTDYEVGDFINTAAIAELHPDYDIYTAK